MRKTKYIKLVITIMVMTVLFGCTKSGEKKVVNSDPEAMMDLSSIGTSKDDYQSYWGTKVHNFAKGNGGYYYLTAYDPLYLMFYDETTHTSYPVCGKADCNHDCATCDAFVGNMRDYSKNPGQNVYYAPGTIYYYEGYIYLLSSEGYLVRVTPDGSERTKLAEVYTFDYTTNTKLLFYDKYVYMYNSAGHLGDNKEYTETIKRYSLDGKTQDTIFEYTGSNSAISEARNYGDHLFFLIQNLTIDKTSEEKNAHFTYKGLYAYNHKTGETGKVIDAEITDYCIDEKSNTIYYYVVADGLYKYNVATKEKNKIYNATDENGSVDLSFDGTNIYMYNGIWVGTASTGDNKIAAKCWVINDSGKVINTIPCDDLLFCFFGDDKYIFAEKHDSTTKKTINVYIDKSSIDTATEWNELP